MNPNKQIHFKHFNGVRFLAAFMVIVCHIEQMKHLQGFFSYTNQRTIAVLGFEGVKLFFVLSGFLITYLLLHEQKQTGTIHIKSFYTRRILRIWPIYYLIVIIGFWVLPSFSFFQVPTMTDVLHQQFGLRLLLYVVLFPHVANRLIGPVAYCGQVWSVGVEEQFYLCWPWLIRYFKQVLYLSITIICVVYGLKLFVYIEKGTFGTASWFQCFVAYIADLQMDCMALGAIAAWILFEQKAVVLSIVYDKRVQVLGLLVLAFVFWRGWHLPLLTQLLYAVLLLNMAGNAKNILKLENSWVNYLGKISYGLYIYQTIAIVLAIRLVAAYMRIDGLGANVLCYGLSFGLSIAMASLSYYLIEKPLLNIKKKFEVVASRS